MLTVVAIFAYAVAIPVGFLAAFARTEFRRSLSAPLRVIVHRVGCSASFANVRLCTWEIFVNIFGVSVISIILCNTLAAAKVMVVSGVIERFGTISTLANMGVGLGRHFLTHFRIRYVTDDRTTIS